MPTVTTKFNPASAHTVLGDKIPDITRLDNQIINLAGRPAEFYQIVIDATVPETALQIQTTLKHVRGGMVFGLTEAAFVTNILPLAANPTIGVAQATLPVSRTYLVLIWGHEV